MFKPETILAPLLCLGTIPFLAGCSRADDKTATSGDILGTVEFVNGGDISAKQSKESLTLSASLGWCHAVLPDEIDLNKNPRLTITLKTKSKCSVYLELKDKNGDRERSLVGRRAQNGVWKVKLELPDTGNEPKDIVVELTEHFRADPKDRFARVIAFSDPSGDIEIRSIRFAEKK